jgi:hypothetical protein
MKANILGAATSPPARAASLLFLLRNGEIGKDGYPARHFSKHYLQKTLYFPA